MAHRSIAGALIAGAASLALAGCGGGGGNRPSLSPPPPAAPPPPPSSAANPLSTPPTGVTATTALASIGVLGDVRWNAELGLYEVDLPGHSDARIVAGGTAPYAQAGQVFASDGTLLPFVVQAWTGYSYTRYGHITPTNGTSDGGHFVFGAATPVGGVPATGSATYQAELDGAAYTAEGEASWGLYGTARFDFDFAAGTLSGHMDPILNGPMEVPPLSRYSFADTVFSAGSTTFSGGFDVTGPTPGSFHGQFTGPAAQELMADFRAPYFDLFSNSWGEIKGVMAGKR